MYQPVTGVTDSYLGPRRHAVSPVPVSRSHLRSGSTDRVTTARPAAPRSFIRLPRSSPCPDPFVTNAEWEDDFFWQVANVSFVPAVFIVRGGPVSNVSRYFAFTGRSQIEDISRTSQRDTTPAQTLVRFEGSVL